MKNNFSENIKLYFVPIVSLLVVGFLVPTVIIPQVKQIKENWKIVSQNSKRLDALEAKAKALEQLEGAQAELDKNLATAESALPIEKDVARLVRGVQNLAVANGLEVSKVEIKPGKTATESATPVAAEATTTKNSKVSVGSTSKTELVFELALKGNLAAFQSFMKSIESTKRLLILNSFKSTLGSGPDYSFSVTINAPFGALPKISEDQLAAAVAELSQNNKKLLKDLESSIFKDVTNDPLPTGPTGVTDPFK